MTPNHPVPLPYTESRPQLEKIERLPNLYRLRLPGDKPNKPTGFYYAVIMRGRKQFRPGPIFATNTTASITGTIGPDPQRFYRLLLP